MICKMRFVGIGSCMRSYSYRVLLILLAFLGVFKDCLLKFIVDAKEIDTVGQEPVLAIIKDPDGRRSASNVVNRHDGTYLVTYSTAMEGKHTHIICPLIELAFSSVLEYQSFACMQLI